jgi:hypothetical protein
MFTDTDQSMRADVTWEVWKKHQKACKSGGRMDGFFKPTCRLAGNRSMTTDDNGLKRCSILSCPDNQDISKKIDAEMESIKTNIQGIEFVPEKKKTRHLKVVNGAVQ